MPIETALRINEFADLDDTKISYWHGKSVWWLYLPGCGLANLSNHRVIEHEDKTITVTPSILLTGHDSGEKTQRHGYLIRGVWNE